MALIRFLPPDLGIDFLGRRKIFLVASAVLLLISVITFAVQGLNFGVDFRGGILMEIKTKGPADLSALRGDLGGLGLGEVTLQQFGEPDDVLINLQRQAGDEEAQAAAIDRVKEALGDRVAEYRRTEFVGPKVGEELRQAGMLATILSLLAIGLYIWFRFEWQFALASLIALVHDVIATVGFYALLQIEFNLSTLAAVLTIAGYSINDTVVVFDRVREDLRKYKKMPVLTLLNAALNRTLSRTILTSFTTMLAVLALFIFGGAVIRGFTAGLLWGLVIGTFSSIGIAVPLLYYLGIRREHVSLPEEKVDSATSRAT